VTSEELNRAAAETIVERRFSGESAGAGETIVESGAAGGAGGAEFLSLVDQAPDTFHGWDIIESFPARGSEADIFLVGKASEQRILKLYRQGLEPITEVHSRIAELSRRYENFFVKILDQGRDEDSGRYYELQEYYSRGTLRRLADSERLTEPAIRAFLEQIQVILATLHDNGVLHLDLKPANILVRGLDPLSVVVTDFGIASLLDTTDSKRVTGVKGTSLYQSPESLAGVVGVKTDWWALGIILLELLAGEHPFEGLQRQVIYYQLTTQGIRVPSVIGGRWRSLVQGLLTRNPEKRWGAHEVGQWLTGIDPAVFLEDAPGTAVDEAPPGDHPHPEWWTRFLISRKFRGTWYVTLEEMLGAMAASAAAWDEGKRVFGQGHLVRWLRSNQDFDRADQLTHILGEGDFIDLGLFRVLCLFRADLPASWRGRGLELGFLREVLQKAAESRLDGDEMVFVEHLLLGTIGDLITHNRVRIGRDEQLALRLAGALKDTPMAGMPLPRRAFLLGQAIGGQWQACSVIEHVRSFLRREKAAEILIRTAATTGFIAWMAGEGALSDRETGLWQSILAFFSVPAPDRGAGFVEALAACEAEWHAFVMECGDLRAEVISLFAGVLVSPAAFDAVLQGVQARPVIETVFRIGLRVPERMLFVEYWQRLRLFARVKSQVRVFQGALLPNVPAVAVARALQRPVGLGWSPDFLAETPLEAYEEALTNPSFLPRRGTLGLNDWESALRFLEGQGVRGPSAKESKNLRMLCQLLAECAALRESETRDPQGYRIWGWAGLVGALLSALPLAFGLLPAMGCVFPMTGLVLTMWAKWSTFRILGIHHSRIVALKKGLA
jgi:hypothetical protein